VSPPSAQAPKKQTASSCSGLVRTIVSAYPAEIAGPRANEVAQDLGYDDAETLKREFNCQPIARWDLYVDTETRQLWLGTKDKTAWVATGLTVK